jgi:hypothetical protein
VTVPLKEVIRSSELSSAWTVRPKPLPTVTLAGRLQGYHQVHIGRLVQCDNPYLDRPAIGEPEIAVGARRDPYGIGSCGKDTVPPQSRELSLAHPVGVAS